MKALKILSAENALVRIIDPSYDLKYVIDKINTINIIRPNTPMERVYKLLCQNKYFIDSGYKQYKLTLDGIVAKANANKTTVIRCSSIFHKSQRTLELFISNNGTVETLTKSGAVKTINNLRELFERIHPTIDFYKLTEEEVALARAVTDDNVNNYNDKMSTMNPKDVELHKALLKEKDTYKSIVMFNSLRYNFSSTITLGTKKVIALLDKLNLREDALLKNNIKKYYNKIDLIVEELSNQIKEYSENNKDVPNEIIEPLKKEVSDIYNKLIELE